jgi:hypothetical protein
VPQAHIQILSPSPEAEEVAAAHIEDGATGPRMRADALHIVNLKRIHAYNAVNKIRISSP